MQSTLRFAASEADNLHRLVCGGCLIYAMASRTDDSDSILSMENKMNLPVQAPPVMRGQDRGTQALPPNAANPTATQSQLLGGSSICAACAIAPPPWSIVCSLLCPWILGGARPPL